MRRLAVALIAFLPCVQHLRAEELLLIGSLAKTASPAVACPSAEEMDRLAQLIRDGDKVAGGKFLLEHRCQMIDAGVSGRVEDVSVWHGQYCFRAVGEPDCVWLMRGFLKSPADK